jgi:protoporphyrinogen oxidase
MIKPFWNWWLTGRDLMEVVLLGAGPCGLTAAWELAKRGVKVTVIEKENEVGGLCKTVHKDGFRFDLGGHRFISKDRELIDDIKSLMGDSLLVRDRKSVIRFKEADFDYPINLQNILSQSSFSMNVKFAVGYFSSWAGFYKSDAPEGSFERWADDKFGRPLNEYFFKPYTEKLWGISASGLSDEWAGQRISLLDAKDAILKSLGLTKSAPRTFATKYLYPKEGIGQIFEFMANEIKRMGGEILLGATPLKFQNSDSTITGVEVQLNSGERNVIKADNFFSTIPLNQTARLIDSKIETELPYRSLRFLNIILSGIENISDNTWVYVPEKDLIMTRIQEPKRRSPFSAPPGRTSVMLEIPCQRGDETWTMPDTKLLDLVLNHLLKLGLDLRPHATECFSTFAEHAYPRMEIGYKNSVEPLHELIDRFDNLKTSGRQGLFKYIFMDTAMLMGRRWARQTLGEDADLPSDETCDEPALLEVQSVIA